MAANTPAGPGSLRKPGPGALPLLTVLVLGGGFCWGLATGNVPFRFSPDGQVYVDTARHVLAGEGLQRCWTQWFWTADAAPMVHYAPGYPLLLATVSALCGQDPAFVAGPMSAAIYIMVLAAVAAIAWNLSRSPMTTALGVALVGLSKPLLVIHGQALSEPLFILLLLLLVWQWMAYWQAPTRLSFWLSAGLCGACVAVRYQGTFLIPVGAGLIALAAAGPLAQRTRRTCAWTGLAVLPGLCWFLRNRLVAADQSERTLAVHWIDYGALWTLVNTIVGWFTPASLPQALRLAVVLACVVLVLAGAWQQRRRFESALMMQWCVLAGVVIGGQLLFLVLARSFFDAYIPLDNRILSTVAVLSLLTLACAGAAQGVRSRLPWITTIVAIAVLGVNVQRSMSWLQREAAATRQASPPAWPHDVTSVMHHAPPATPVFTNYAGRIIWHLGRPAKYLPHGDDPRLAEFASHLQDTAGLVVYFHERTLREQIVELQTLESLVDLDCHEARDLTLCTAANGWAAPHLNAAYGPTAQTTPAPFD